MSQNDLELYQGGDLAPYQPGGVDLFTPDAESHWGDVPVDYLSTPGQQIVNLQDPQVQANIQNLANVFTTDMASLGFSQTDIQLCIGWFKQSLASPITRMPARKHNFELWQMSNDAGMNAFANFAWGKGLSQQLIQSICYWMAQLDDYQHSQGRFAPQQVQRTTSADPTDALSDADYDRVVAINEQAQAQTRGYLSDLWGSSYAANMRVVNTYFQNLPANEQEHLNQFTTGWVKGTNTVDVLLGLYKQAIGSGSLPKNGAEVSREIASIENVMKTDRKAYMRDEQLQARYRELLRMRGF